MEGEEINDQDHALEEQQQQQQTLADGPQVSLISITFVSFNLFCLV
jgi:hypothetical protein